MVLDGKRRPPPLLLPIVACVSRGRFGERQSVRITHERVKDASLGQGFFGLSLSRRTVLRLHRPKILQSKKSKNRFSTTSTENSSVEEVEEPFFDYIDRKFLVEEVEEPFFDYFDRKFFSRRSRRTVFRLLRPKILQSKESKNRFSTTSTENSSVEGVEEPFFDSFDRKFFSRRSRRTVFRLLRPKNHSCGTCLLSLRHIFLNFSGAPAPLKKEREGRATMAPHNQATKEQQQQATRNSNVLHRVEGTSL